MTFAEELKNWRGKKFQKEVHEMFGVKIETYQKWEQGVNEPSELAKRQARWIMAAESLGVPLQVYTHHYQIIIKRVAEEIQNRK